jgi:hypothetical protein
MASLLHIIIVVADLVRNSTHVLLVLCHLGSEDEAAQRQTNVETRETGLRGSGDDPRDSGVVDHFILVNILQASPQTRWREDGLVLLRGILPDLYEQMPVSAS